MPPPFKFAYVYYALSIGLLVRPIKNCRNYLFKVQTTVPVRILRKSQRSVCSELSLWCLLAIAIPCPDPGRFRQSRIPGLLDYKIS